MSWSLEPGTWNLIDSEGRTQFTWVEFNRQRWPDCPVCGSQIEVEPIPTPSLDTGENLVILGNCRCPRGHTPRDVEDKASL